ncbi:MAG: ATP-binding protein [Desulfobulbaceae bacterium]|nr:ATP-binding protein [Desulfobulbaceae bacterium]
MATKILADHGLNFKISAGLKRIIGRDLITNNLVAVFELVKNSFDAHASRVDLVFEKDRLLIIDNGKGMSYADIIEKWLFVAYSAKSEGTEDDYRDQIETKKAYAGSKGVGRFSCDRLGSSLTMYTTTNDPEGLVHVIKLDWDLFEGDAKKEFYTVPVEYSTVERLPAPAKSPQPAKGTVIEIQGLRDKWERHEILNLKSSLAKLINPFGSSFDSFQIFIRSDNELAQDLEIIKKSKNPEELNTHEIVNGKIDNFIFETLSAKTTLLTVTLTDNGETIESSLIDRGELIYKIKEPNYYQRLSGSGFSCHLFYLNQSAKLTFGRRMGVSTKDFGSVFLFRNGFRVFPIGEGGDDTFKIDLRKQQGYARYLGTRDIIGRIDVTGSEDDFKESTSRDQGLIQTPAYLELEECFREKGLKRLEKYVVDVNWKDALDTESEDISRLTGDKARARIIEVVSRLANAKDVTLVAYSRNLIGILDEKAEAFEKSLANLKLVAEKTADNKLFQQITRAENAYNELRKAEQEARSKAEKERKAREVAEAEARKEKGKRKRVESAYEEEKKRNLFLSSATTLDYDTILNLHHQIGIYSADIHHILANQIDKVNSGETLDSEDLMNLFEQLSFKNQQVMSVSRFATKANFRLDSDKLEDDVVAFIVQYIDEICSIYAGDGMDITVVSGQYEFILAFKPIEISMLIDNLVNNASKAGASLMQFNIQQTSKKELEITITDDGRGINPNILEPDRIFEKGFSTTSGSGLGLYHAKFMLEQMGGDIRLNEQYSNGAQFLIRIRK